MTYEMVVQIRCEARHQRRDAKGVKEKGMPHKSTRGLGSVVSSPAGSRVEPWPRTGFGAF